MIRTLTGDCRTILPTLDAGSVQCCITSPPYYGLRSYGVGADKGEMGSEPTPEAYLAQMVAVFREVRRVLRDDGTCWVNMGDSYASSMTSDRRMYQPTRDTDRSGGVATQRDPQIPGRCTTGNGIKPKDLLMMPARLALALQADGWWLRSDIIWHKPNPMPESVTDRPTSAHEHVFLLTKRSRYYYDADAVREDQSGGTHSRGTKWRDGDMPKIAEPGSGIKNNRSLQAAMDDLPPDAGRSCRNVWTIATSPFSDAHFATFPPALVERCIRAGTSERGCCAACGKPWVRETSAEYERVNGHMHKHANKGRHSSYVSQASGENLNKIVTTTGWATGCKCEADVRPCVILDPFAGAGTTMLVADRLQRDAIGIELNPSYVGMATNRVHDDAPLFSSWPPAEDPADARMAHDLAGDEYQRPSHGQQLEMFREAAD